MGEPITVFIVDDLRLLREGLISLLAEQDDIAVLGTAASGSEALEKIKEHRPAVALIDIGLPDKDGLLVTQGLRQEAPEVKVIILGMPDLTDEIMACIEAGAAGYVLKEATFDYLLETIRAVHKGESFCSPRMAGHGSEERVKNGPALAGHGAEAVRDAIAEAIRTLPEQLCRSLTWDQGAEMAQHTQLRIDTGIAVYFCDPHSPWQRGTNENTNGLLRQYFPKGTDLSMHSAREWEAVALALNTRPRKTLEWRTLAEALDELLQSTTITPVATTA